MKVEERETETAIRERILRAKGLVPREYLPPLPKSADLSAAPEWYAFEHDIWALGEQIRRLLIQAPRLRRNLVVQAALLEVACDRRALRGRQSFIMLLGNKWSAIHAAALAAHLDDPSVDGHVISTLYRMKARGLVDQVTPFTAHEQAWIRREARRYLEWEEGLSNELQATRPAEAMGPPR